MMAVMLLTLSVLLIIVEDEVIEGNATGHIYESRGDNITSKNVLQDYLPFPSQFPSHIDDTYTDNYSFEEKKSFENSVTHIAFPMNSNTNTDKLAAVNTSDDQGEGLRSVHLDVNLQDCSKRSQNYRVRGNTGTILIVSTPITDSQLYSTFLVCSIKLEVPPGMLGHVLVIKRSYYEDTSRIMLFDAENTLIVNKDVSVFPEEFITYSNIVRFQLEISSRYAFDLYLNFTAILEASRPKLVVNFTSTTKGYIEASQPSENIECVPFVNTWTHLVAPDDHIILINIHTVYENKKCFFGLDNFIVIFHTEVNSTEYKICGLGHEVYTEPLIYHGRVRVQYKSYTSYDRPYFKIQFSFHHVLALPVQVSEGRWNCSAVRWEDMQHHFPCNFVSNCVGGEDEAGCWPGDDTCSPGTFQADGRCFSLFRSEQQELSWSLASNWCQQRGGQLPSLSTRRLWDDVTEHCIKIGECFIFFIGARLAPPTISAMYRNSWVWSDGTIAYFMKLWTMSTYLFATDTCSVLMNLFGINKHSHTPLFVESCEKLSVSACILCETPVTPSPYEEAKMQEIRTTGSLSTLVKSAFVRCPDHHFTHVFLACDEASSCWGSTDGATDSCPAPLTSLPPFQCVGVHQSVPYTLVCDHRADCKDGSDEDFCYFPPCDVFSPFRCAGRRCVQLWERCNGQVDCDDRADEDRCSTVFRAVHDTLDVDLPLKIDLDSKGKFTFSSYRKSENSSPDIFSCTDSYFTCFSLEQVCLPVYLRCNGVNDCPGHEDEAACDRYTCPGFYRCRGSQVCVHESHVCDGIYHCPQHDDEILCNETCPHNCVCYGWAFGCFDIFSAASYPNLRYLDGSGTLMNLGHLVNNVYLVHLNLVRCNLTELHKVTLPNLRTLDVSNNELTYISSSHFAGLQNLHSLKISFNPIKVLSFVNIRQTSSLKILDLSDIFLPNINFSIFSFSALSTLNLSASHLDHVTGHGFGAMDSLSILDLRHCPVTVFPREMFHSLSKLEKIYADNYKLCCPVTLPPGFNVLNCHAPSEVVSSCDDLLRSGLYRAGVAIFASLAILGNLSILIYRLFFFKRTGNIGYDVFVTNLCVADFLMGLYLSIIGISDFRYRGSYVWEDVGWRNSSLCKLAGFTSLLSCEVSVFIIFLITVDRFLVLRFPFSQVHFGKRSAQWACAVSWLTGVALAVVPLLPMTSHWEFYSQTSICIPLPTSRVDYPGRSYSFAVIIILNFIFLILIFIGQIIIYWSVRATSISTSNTSKTIKEFIIARRLITVVMSDFLCWFPVCLTGILASYDVPIPGEVNVGIAIFILPINAAVNPFLYTINIYLERRRRRIEDDRRKRIIGQLQCINGQTGAKLFMTSNDALDLIKTLLLAKRLSREELRNLLEDTRNVKTIF